jgi:metallo-beta-lactamase class B
MRNTLFFILLGFISSTAQAQTDWNAPFPSHRMIGNIHFIGTDQLATFLITTDAGHILVNSDFESTVPILKENVESLGFSFSDIKVILGSHAHGDHMQGDILLKELTGADVMVMEQDIPLLAGMHQGGSRHPVDRVLHDGDEVTLGDTTLTARLTPGHTPGCTSWELTVEEDGEQYNALIICSFGANANYVLVGENTTYPNIVENYRYTYARARAINVDVFLGSHGFFYNMAQKYEKLQNLQPGEPNPYIDSTGYLQHVDMQEANFQRMLSEQQNR